MTVRKTILFGALAITASCAISAGSLAQDTMRTVEQYTCKEIMRDDTSSRDASIAFLHGYLLGKGGSSEFDLEVLTEQTDTFIDQCLDNPTAGALETMVKVKG